MRSLAYVRYYLGLFTVNAALTVISLYYPLRYYSETHSSTGLSMVITYYNVLNALGAYFWGYLIDRTNVRKPLFIAHPIAQILPSVCLFETGNPILYGVMGFTAALGSPLYSSFVLERFPLEDLPKQNSYLSIASLGGNILGSLISLTPINKELVVVTLLAIAIPMNVSLIPNYRSENGEHSGLSLSDVKEVYKPLIIIFIFNTAAETFYILYLPQLEASGAPSSLYFMSYMTLYAVQLVLFFKVPSFVKDLEGFWALLAVTIRSSIISLFVTGIPLHPYALSALFVAFGSMWSIFSVPFYSLVLKTVRRNRGQITGLLSAGADFGTSIGSFATYVEEALNPSLAYEISFLGFAVSGIMWASYVRDLKRLSFSLLPRRASSQPRPVVQREAYA